VPCLAGSSSLLSVPSLCSWYGPPSSTTGGVVVRQRVSQALAEVEKQICPECPLTYRMIEEVL
jgi:hypothetical protein